MESVGGVRGDAISPIMSQDEDQVADTLPTYSCIFRDDDEIPLEILISIQYPQQAHAQDVQDAQDVQHPPPYESRSSPPVYYPRRMGRNPIMYRTENAPVQPVSRLFKYTTCSIVLLILLGIPLILVVIALTWKPKEPMLEQRPRH